MALRVGGPCAGAVVAFVLLVPTPTGAAEEADPASCVSYRAEARFSIGYDHLVHVTNACERVVQCHVSTNVNPTGVEVRVAPQRTETVLTFRGSPASTFTAEVDCAWAS